MALGLKYGPVDPPPYLVCVQHGRICALVACEQRRTTVIQSSAAASSVLWSIGHAEGQAYLSPDGRFLVFASSSKQWVTKWAQPDDPPLVVFWGPSGVVSTVPVSRILPGQAGIRQRLFNPEDVQDAAEFLKANPESWANPDFLYWGDILGFNPKGQFEVRLLRKGVVRLDPRTSEAVH